MPKDKKSYKNKKNNSKINNKEEAENIKSAYINEKNNSNMKLYNKEELKIEKNIEYKETFEKEKENNLWIDIINQEVENLL